jgi:intracellular sulfur oxidation DsrE/DsrF family protein
VIFSQWINKARQIMTEKFHWSEQRRRFLARLGAGAGILGASVVGAQPVGAQSASTERWQPARHDLDNWYDRIPGKHRFLFDTTTPEGLAMALQFSNTFFEASSEGYGLTDSDHAVITVVRYRSTSFGYNDTIWAKYGVNLSDNLNHFLDPKTKEPPIVNVHATSGGRMDGLLKKGMHVAVCQRATRNLANTLARATGGNSDSIFSELGSNLVTNGHLVPAGIVAVNRAQEHGYAVAYSGF